VGVRAKFGLMELIKMVVGLMKSSHNRDSSWTKSRQGEVLYFHLNSNKLTMHSVNKQEKNICH
jgi:hypothetical protein